MQYIRRAVKQGFKCAQCTQPIKIRCWAALSLSGHRGKFLSSAKKNNLPFCFTSRTWIFFCSLPFCSMNEQKLHSWFIYLLRNTETPCIYLEMPPKSWNSSQKLVPVTRCFWNRQTWRAVALHTCLQSNQSYFISWNFVRTRDTAYFYELFI